MDDPGTVQELDIYGLHLRHPGFQDAARPIADNFAVNAAICMERHSRSPRIWSVQMDRNEKAEYIVRWDAPTPAQTRACKNDDDATRDGAYGIALASVDRLLGLVALCRAPGRSGVDFYLIPANTETPDDPDIDLDREDLIGLEVSGISNDDDLVMRSRVSLKVKQAQQGRSPHPAIAGIVGFRTARVVFRSAKA